ncbi:MAG: uroporphyrinogen-III synthase [Sphingomonadales bacterium]|nr:uroporphyrinogen-III synthase [Sphingomonadales bacterium]
MTALLVVRPEPGCTATVAAARAMGLEAHGFPLFSVVPAAWDAPEPAAIDGLLIGSANALRHGGPKLARFAGLPVYAVGEATAEAARAAGHTVFRCGAGGLQAMLDQVHPRHNRLLRLAGRERVELNPPAGITITERVVYASEPQPIPAALAAMLAQPVVILLHSAEAARHFAAECERLNLPRRTIRLATIGPRVAAAAESGWAEVAAAPRPADAPLLALARQMCQEAAGSRGLQD